MHGQNLLIDIAIILSMAFPLLFFGKRFRVPEVIAFLLTGVMIGPHALGLIREPAEVEAIAEIGVALILFFIGLEVPVRRLRSLGKTITVSGSLQILLTVAITVAIALALHVELKRAIFYGLLISLGSTAVVIPIITARNEIRAPYARRFLGVSLFQDLAVIPLMLLVPAFAGRDKAPPFAEVMLRFTIAVLVVGLLIIAARVVIPRLFLRIAALRSRQIFTAASIVLIVATIAVAQRLGISPALGAFAAGIVVGDTEFIHEVAGILRPFRDFLGALFFASIGMLLDPAFVARNIVAVAGVVALVFFIKIAAAYPAFRASSALPRTSLRAAFALVPIGEFSFLLSQEGEKYGVLSEPSQQMFIAVAVATLATTPLFVSAGRAAAERVHLQKERDDSSSSIRTNHIVLVGYGLNGRNIARMLTATHIAHVLIEEDPHIAREAREAGNDVITADATDPEAVRGANVETALAVVVVISDPEASKRIVKVVRSFSPNVHILVRTRHIAEVDRLREVGANEIIPEEFETSIEIVTRLMRVLAVPGNVIAAQLRLLRDEGYLLLRDPALRVAEGRRLSAVLAAGTSQTFLVMPDTVADGKTLAELGIADDHVAVPAMLRDATPISPVGADEVLQSGDTLFLVGAHEDLLRVVTRLDERTPV